MMLNERRAVPASFDETSATASTVIATIGDLVQDWDVDEPIGCDTCVVADLGFESVDLIQMIGALEQAFGLRNGSLVDMLVVDGRYVDDLSIGQIADAVGARIA